MAYAISGLTSLYETLGDFVVYRNLVPADPRLPSFGHLRDHLGLASSSLPRKAELIPGLSNLLIDRRRSCS